MPRGRDDRYDRYPQDDQPQRQGRHSRDEEYDQQLYEQYDDGYESEDGYGEYDAYDDGYDDGYYQSAPPRSSQTGRGGQSGQQRPRSSQGSQQRSRSGQYGQQRSQSGQYSQQRPQSGQQRPRSGQSSQQRSRSQSQARYDRYEQPRRDTGIRYDRYESYDRYYDDGGKKKSKTGMIIALVVVILLLLALEIFMMTRCSREETAVQQPANFPAQSEQFVAPTALPTDVPTDTPAPVQDTPVPTLAPTPMPSPTLAPPPTPEPTVAPGTVVASGTASSDTGTNLRLDVKWEATDMGGGTTRLSITGTVHSYRLQVMGRDVTVKFGSHSTTVKGNAIMIDENVESNTELFSTTMDVSTGETGTLEVSWEYNGTYSKVSLPTVNASADISY